MSYPLEYKGGVIDHQEEHTREKFLLFLVVGGDEIPSYQAQRDSLLTKLMDKGIEYDTPHKIVKVFVSQQGYGIQRRFHSFYMELRPRPAEIVTVFPYSITQTGLHFTARVRFLLKPEVAKLLPRDHPSLKFLEKQSPLPLDLLKQMVVVDDIEVRKEVRHIRMADPDEEEQAKENDHVGMKGG